jgi:chitodextrinase
LLYVAASATPTGSPLNQLLPLAVLLLLTTVLAASAVACVQELRDYWSTHTEKKKAEVKVGEQMSVEASQKMLMHEFEMKMMPSMTTSTPLVPTVEWDPQQQGTNEHGGRLWEYYPVLNNF